MSHFASYLTNALQDRKQIEAAAQMGISPSQLNKLLAGQGCERVTLAKVFAGISKEPRERALCVQAYLRDIADLAGDDARFIEIRVN